MTIDKQEQVHMVGTFEIHINFIPKKGVYKTLKIRLSELMGLNEPIIILDNRGKRHYDGALL